MKDDWLNHDWHLDLSGLRHTLPPMAWAQILLALFGTATVITLVAIFFGK